MAVGSATLDFGSFAAPSPSSEYGHPKTEAKVTITGQTGILATSLVEAWLSPEVAGTTNHSMDEHFIENIVVKAGNIVPGTGFDIQGECTLGGTYGQFKVGWVTKE
jgi:hypothetical protein